MCFTHDCYSVEFASMSVVKCRKPQRCDECGEIIPKGDLAEYHSGKGEDGFYSSYFCGACELTRDRIADAERAEGCTGNEIWCPVGELGEYCDDHNIERATRDDGQHYLRNQP
mgnify:CR=1 FL=1